MRLAIRSRFSTRSALENVGFLSPSIVNVVDYKYLSIFKRQFPQLTILGLTATATLKVIDDIRQILNIPHSTLFRAPFNRKNLFYEVLHKSDVGKDAFNDLINCIQRRFDQQSGKAPLESLDIRFRPFRIGIVYCLSQKDAEEVCTQLQRSGKRSRRKMRCARVLISTRNSSWLLPCRFDSGCSQSSARTMDQEPGARDLRHHCVR